MSKHTVIGLTGQSGAGKTMVSEYFADNGFAVINCDMIARNVTRTGSECNKALAAIFPECFDEDISLDRRAMAEIVFSDKAKLELLNKTIFPYITADINAEIKTLAGRGERYIILDAPTLFEAGADKLCDCIISCVADKDIRAKRIAERDNISEEQILRRFDSQKSEEFFRQRSDYVIENNKDVESAYEQCRQIADIITHGLCPKSFVE